MKKMKGFSIAILLAYLFLFSYNFQLHAQNDCNYERPHFADQWVFGNNARIDFLYDPPSSSYATNLPEMPWSVTSISDKNGELVLFSDGQYIYNGSYYRITGGDGLLGYPASKPSSLFVPVPGNSNKFYLFTVDIYIPGFRENGINFSIIERGNGPAKVINKNTLLMKENAQKLCGVQHANGRDYWVVAHGLGNNKGNKLYAYLVSDTIIKTVASNDPFNHILDPPTYFNGVGGMKFSPDGSKLALVSYGLGLVELFDFNNETGVLTFKSSTVLGQVPFANSIEFSPDNSKLYITASVVPTANEGSRLIQYDLNLADPFAPAEEFVLQTFQSTTDSVMGELQLAVDGKIYMSKHLKSGRVGKEYLGVIYNPDRPKAACNYNELNHQANNGFYLDGGQGLLGLPAFVSSFLDIPHFTFINQCHHDTTLFSITNTANIDDAAWDFNNTDGTAFLGDPLHPAFVFTDPGDYTVDLTETYSNTDYNYSRQVRVHALPFVDLGQGTDTIYILPNSSVRLDAGDWDFYQWFPGGQTTRYLDVTESGEYAVMVTDSNCCKNGDKVYILFADLVFPNAFNPNSTITVNNMFKPLGTTSTLANYKLLIYNRWGQLLFESDDPEEGWDGTYNGEQVPMGTYVYTAVFTSFESGVLEAQEFKKSGSVTLVR
jgi:gliding motility-associated-like protein